MHKMLWKGSWHGEVGRSDLFGAFNSEGLFLGLLPSNFPWGLPIIWMVPWPTFHPGTLPHPRKPQEALTLDQGHTLPQGSIPNLGF